MSANRLIAAYIVVVGLWLVLAASASAVPPPNPIATTIPIQSTTGPTCPTNQTAPPAWLDPEALDAYSLSPAQQVPGPGGSPVTTQTLSFGSPTFSISTPGCWALLGSPESEPTSPFELEMWKTSQSVEINGMYLVPVNSSNPPTLIVANNGTLFATGSDTRYDVEITSNGSPDGPLAVVGRVDLGQTPYRWDPVSGYLGSFGPSPQGPTFAGQPITGGEITITNPSGICPQPSAHVVAQLPLPGEFSTGPSSGPPPTGEADYNVSLPVQCGSSSGGGGGGAGGFSAPSPACQCAGRVHAAETGDLASGGNQPIHLTVPNLYLGGLEIRNAFLDYAPSTELWTGGGDLQFGDGSIHAAPPPPNEGIGIFANGGFDYGGAQYNFSPPVPLYTGPPPVDLTEIGVTFALRPTVITGDATISVAGGEVTISGTVLVVFGDANEPYTYEPGALQGVTSLQIGSTPIKSFAAGISGIVDLNSLPGVGGMQLGNGYVFYESPSYFEFAGTVSQSLFGVVQASGGVTGALDLHSGQYNLAGNLQVCANFPLVGQFCPGALTAVLSSTGFGACGQFLGITGGFTYAWGDSSPHIFGGPFVSCDLGPVTVVVHPASDVGPRASPGRAARSALISRAVCRAPQYG